MTAALHLVVLVEEPSMEAFLQGLLPRLLPQGRSFELHAFQGKGDLLGKLEARLRGYAAWLPPEWRLVVVVDRDEDDCRQLKQRMEDLAARSGLQTRSRARQTVTPARWQLVNRIAIEELEAWYFGDWPAVHAAYPRVPRTLGMQSSYRQPDAIVGGTWEAFERVMQRHGYFKGRLAKIEAARTIAPHVDAARSTSASFRVFCAALQEACSGQQPGQ